MKCRYCGLEMKEDAPFCDNCGQSTGAPNTTKNSLDAFWEVENLNKHKEVITQLYHLKGTAEQIQNSIAHGRNYKSTRLFIKTMRVLILICIVIFVFALDKTVEEPIDHYYSLCIASTVTAVAILIIIARAKKISERVEEDETDDARELKIKISELTLLRKEEQSLKKGLFLVDKNLLSNPPLQDLRKPIAIDKKKITGWHIATVLFTVIAVVIFAVSYYFAPSIIDSIIKLGGLA